jgi:hypothetical protein
MIRDSQLVDTAQEIYEAMPYDGPDGAKPAWVPFGNSDKQDEARRYARIARSHYGRATAIPAEGEALIAAWLDTRRQVSEALAGLGRAQEARRIAHETLGEWLLPADIPVNTQLLVRVGAWIFETRRDPSGHITVHMLNEYGSPDIEDLSDETVDQAKP